MTDTSLRLPDIIDLDRPIPLVQHVRFQGAQYLLINGDCLTTGEALRNGQKSYAHVFSSGDVVRHTQLLGTRDEIEIIKQEVTPEEIRIAPKALAYIFRGHLVPGGPHD